MVGFTPDLMDLERKNGWLAHSSHLSATVNIAGLSDRRGRLASNSKGLLGKGYEDNLDLRCLASPVVHINKQSPPVYTLHGDQDKVVVPQNAKQLEEALKKVGIEHDLRIVQESGHNPINAIKMAPVAAWLTKKLEAKN